MSSLLVAVSGFLLVAAPPFRWLYFAGLTFGIALYALAELLIPLYAEPDQ